MQVGGGHLTRCLEAAHRDRVTREASAGMGVPVLEHCLPPVAPSSQSVPCLGSAHGLPPDLQGPSGNQRGSQLQSPSASAGAVCGPLHQGISYTAKWTMSASALVVVAGRIFSLIYTHLKLSSREHRGQRFISSLAVWGVGKALSSAARPPGALAAPQRAS